MAKMAKAFGVLLISFILLMTSISFASAWVFEEVEVNQPRTITQEKWTYWENNYGKNQGFTLTHTTNQPQYNYYSRTDSIDDGTRRYVNWGGNYQYNKYDYNNRWTSWYNTKILELAMQTYANRHYGAYGFRYGRAYSFHYNRPSYFGYTGYVSRVNWW